MSKETVLLHQWGLLQDNLVFSTGLIIHVKWPPWSDLEADISPVNPSSENLDLLQWRANARNVSLQISLQWPIHIIKNIYPHNNYELNMYRSGLSIGFEVDGDILKVDGYGGRRPPHKWRVWGQSPRKQNEFNVWHCQKLTFLIYSQ